jgi:hypothetical protein
MLSAYSDNPNQCQSDSLCTSSAARTAMLTVCAAVMIAMIGAAEPDWQDPTVTQINRQAPRAVRCIDADAATEA